MTTPPLVTYITVVRNAVDAIAETVNSIGALKTDRVEYVVIDGRSTDGTRELLQQLRPPIDTLISESDKGIYDAMNKGIRLAKGVFICFINVGDRLQVFPQQLLEAADRDNAAVVALSVTCSDGSRRLPEFSDRMQLENTLPHQGLYYRRNSTGEYDLAYKVFSDFDMNQRLYKSGKKVLLHPETTNAFHATDGISQNKKYLEEIFAIVDKNFGSWMAFKSRLWFRLKYGRLGKIWRKG